MNILPGIFNNFKIIFPIVRIQICMHIVRAQFICMIFLSFSDIFRILLVTRRAAMFLYNCCLYTNRPRGKPLPIFHFPEKSFFFSFAWETRYR